MGEASVHRLPPTCEIRVGKKNLPKKPKKTHLKKQLKMFFLGVFWGFFKFFIFYENNTNFSL
jgi:hypothetical protein